MLMKPVLIDKTLSVVPVVHLGKTKKLLISTEWIPFSFRQKTNVMSNLGSSYTKILALLHELESRDNYLSQIRIPKLSDKQLIALVFAAESLGPGL
jgi:hypothetical protein